MPRWLIMGPIFCVRKFIEAYRERKKNYDNGNCKLKKGIIQVPEDVLWRILKKRGSMKCVKIIQGVFDEARSNVKITYEETEDLTMFIKGRH